MGILSTRCVVLDQKPELADTDNKINTCIDAGPLDELQSYRCRHYAVRNLGAKTKTVLDLMTKVKDMVTFYQDNY